MAPRRSSFDDWPSRPIKVEGGIQARSRRGAIGETWWSRRFLDLLESLGVGGRLSRGKTYARQGQVLAIDVGPGEVTATVQGSRLEPYRVRIGVPALAEQDWLEIEQALVERAVFLAKLLAGEMPTDIEDAFHACGLTLFPASVDEITSSCSCPDWVHPCKHVAAVYYLLGEAFDDDPFLIFWWRGRDRDELLDHLRRLRGAGTTVAAAVHDDPWADVEAVPPPALPVDVDAFWSAGERPPLPAWPTAVAPEAVLIERDALDRELNGRPLLDHLRAAYPTMVRAARARLAGAGDVGE